MKKYLLAIALLALTLTLTSCGCKEHVFTEWEEALAANCTEAGTEVRGCENCKYTEEREVEPSGHSLKEWEVALASTCTKAGTEVRGCENCKYTEEREIALLEHSFGEWVELSVPTCKDPYDASRTCAACGFSETQTMEPKGHTYDFELHRNHVVHEHPSCFKEGISKYICIVCNDPDDVIYEPMEKMEHRWEGGGCESASYCIYCNTKGAEPTGHDWSQYGYMCSKCGLVMGLGKGG